MCTILHQSCSLGAALELAGPQSLSQLEWQMLRAKGKALFVCGGTSGDAEGGGMGKQGTAWMSG